MARPDLLALTLDDLAVISNWGLVKRAQRELNSGQFSSRIYEDDEGSITVEWSDPVTCHLPATATPQDSHCSCPATTCCRHIIRSILAYQSQTAPDQESVDLAPQAPDDLKDDPKNDDPEDSDPDLEIPQITPAFTPVWDPGQISDAELERFHPQATLTRSRRQFEAEQVIEVFRGQKPAARLHSLGHYVRFLVPHDLRYTYCDCRDPSPCIHVALAVWAFRRLDPQQTQGLIFPRTPVSPPTLELDQMEQVLKSLIEVGLAYLPPPVLGQLHRLRQICEHKGLIWLAVIWEELLQHQRWYVERDARFSSLDVQEWVGEIRLRAEVLRQPHPPVPIQFVGGSTADRASRLGTSRLIGLGCGVQVHPQGITLAVYLHHTESGSVLVHSKVFPDPDPQAAPPDCHQLAQGYALMQSSWRDLGASQILMRGGKRTPEDRVIPGRQMTIMPQTWQWQDLRPPVLIQDSGELRSHLGLQPPACLRPRRLTENFYVWQVAEIESFRFDPKEQAIQGRFKDLAGLSVSFSLPFFHRSRWGTEALLYHLQTDRLLFVSGQVSLSHQDLVLTPVAFLFERGEERFLLQPWIQGSDLERIDPGMGTNQPMGKDRSHPVKTYLNQIETALGELILVGLQEQDPDRIWRWRQLHHQGQRLGFRQLCGRIEALISALAAEGEDQVPEGSTAVLDLAMGLRVMQEVSISVSQ